VSVDDLGVDYLTIVGHKVHRDACYLLDSGQQLSMTYRDSSTRHASEPCTAVDWILLRQLLSPLCSLGVDKNGVIDLEQRMLV